MYSPIKKLIQLEINTFTHPSPVEYKEIESFIYRFLKDNNFDEDIEKYQLHPFKVLTLSIERTFCEKLLSLARLSYEGPERLKTKVRHFYDIAQIMKVLPQPVKIKETLKLALEDDRNNSTFSGIWLDKPLFEAPVFKDFDPIWKMIESTYKQEISSLVWSGILIEPEKIKQSFAELKQLLINIA